MSSCSNDIDEGQTPGVNSSGRAITFEVWTNKQTKAATTTAGITDFRLLAVDTFAALAADRVLINGALVTGSGSTWAYSPLAYWPETDTVNFYGFSPASANGVTNALAGQSDPPSIDYELPGHSVNTSIALDKQEDLLVVNHTNDYAHEGASGVALNFRHALSRILVQAKSDGLNGFTVLGVTLKNIKSSGTLDLSLFPKDADAFPYPVDNATIDTVGYQTFWDTTAGTDGDLVADIPTGGVIVSGSKTDYTDIIGDDDALYVIPQENAEISSLTKATNITGNSSFTSTQFYIEITYKEDGPGAAVTYAVPVPAIVGDAYASSLAFEMERQYTFQFELFGNNKPIRITKVTASDYDKVDQKEPLRTQWAGSNIYWDGTKLTFADSDSTGKPIEQYQGVFFRWGSLVGISPSGTTWAPQKTYVPDVTAVDGSWSVIDTMTWAYISYMATSPTPFSSSNPYLADQTTDANIADLKGDICVYLTKIGAAPKGKRWRMPTGDEFGVRADYARIGNLASNIDGNTVNDDGTTAIPVGYNKINLNRPYFPTSGFRESSKGTLTNVGTTGNYWSSSPASNNNGSNLSFTNGALLLHNGSRQNGFAVRCIVE
jgi:hypothetical protein